MYNINNSKCFIEKVTLFCRAGRWIPLGCIGKLFEVVIHDERLSEVLGVFDYLDEDDPGAAIGQLEDAEVLGKNGSAGIGHAVFPVITGLQMSGDRLQAAGALVATPAHDGPGCDGIALPTGLQAGRRLEFRRLAWNVNAGLKTDLPLGCRRREMEQARLGAVVGFELERVIVLPGDVQVVAGA